MKKVSRAPYVMLALALIGIAVALYDAYAIYNGRLLWCPPPINGCMRSRAMTASLSASSAAPICCTASLPSKLVAILQSTTARSKQPLKRTYPVPACEFSSQPCSIQRCGSDLGGCCHTGGAACGTCRRRMCAGSKGSSCQYSSSSLLHAHLHARELIAFFQEARAGLDGSVAGSPYANLAVVRCCRNNKPGGPHADQAGENPVLDVFCEQHQTLRCLAGLFDYSPRFVLQLLLCCCPGQRGTIGS